jgi:integrating conjugative element protein (TIGR03765 family)
MNRGRFRRLPFIGLILAAAPAHAELAVIHDSGRTRPITDYLDRPETIHPDETPASLPSPAELLGQVLPIRTPEMTPGEIAPTTVSLPYLSRPLFLIGSDDFSKRWLAQHRDRLGKLQAAGMLIQAEREADLERVRTLAGSLPILPASGSELARHLNLSHYPVLISSTRIEQ